MTVGMQLDLNIVLDRFMSIIGLTVALMASKSLIIMALCRVFGFSLSTAIHVGLLLSQGGEFSFVLFDLADIHHLLDHSLAQTLLVVVTMSMALTPPYRAAGQETCFHAGEICDFQARATWSTKRST